MSLVTLLFGRPLATEEEEKEQIGALTGVPFLGLDALASAAYGPEAALTVLLPLGALGLRYIGPISLLVIGLLVIVYFSYRQTIGAYPKGGGSYVVARENLGTNAGLIAAAALMLDYVLNVAVAISAGVGALVSAVPALLPHTLPLCLAILALLVVINLRGARSSGLAFLLPTYAFVGCLFAVIGVGVWKTLTAGGAPAPMVAPPPAPAATVTVAGLWLLCHAFSSGCTAMTGVEAVSDGVPAFRQPTVVLARRTLTMIIVVLAVLLAGVAFLSRSYGIVAMEQGHAGYQSILSQMVAAVVGRGAFYYVTMSAIVAVLCLSANTSFADFPRLCRFLAADRFLPEPFVRRGRRLAFSYGIFVLALFSGILLVVFQGLTEHLIPLFAVGAFLAFTMSQAGMVAHWRRSKERHARHSLVINAVGAVATAITLAIILVEKFTKGAWLTVLLIGGTFVLFRRVARHYRQLEVETRNYEPLDLSPEPPPVVVVPMRRWDRVAEKGLRFALGLSDQVYALQVITGDRRCGNLDEAWPELVEEPAKKHGLNPPKLVVLRSRYRELFGPLIRYITRLASVHPERQVAVVVPQIVERRWYNWLLHNHTASILKTLLLIRGRRGIVVINTPWFVDEPPKPA